MTAIRIAILLNLWLLLGCSRSSDKISTHEENKSHSANVRGIVNLGSSAQTAIGLETSTAVRQLMPKTLETSGWLVTPPGRSTVVKAAATGFFLPVSDSTPLEVGALVTKGGQLGSLEVFLSPQEEAQMVIAKEEADILMKQALVSQGLAEEQLRNLETSGGSSAVAGVRLLELREVVKRNQVAYEEARDKLPFLPSEPYAQKLELKSVPVVSPLPGRVTELHVASRQLVVVGDPLWTVADWSSLWVKVPVFEGDLPRVLADESASITVPGIQRIEKAVRIAVPQPTEAGRRTVDLFYRLENTSGTLRPGQAVSTGLPLGETREQVVVPRASVIWDGMGNAWVYVKDGPESFRRQKVELGTGNNEVVVAERGVNAGEEIVTKGVQSLYGEEFKGQLLSGDDD